MTPEERKQFLLDGHGWEIDEGWHGLVHELIQRLLNSGWDGDIHQIKEKFGGLRFYVGEASIQMHDLIDVYEELSFTICERCGAPGKVRSTGWIKTLCDLHAEQKDD